MAFAPSNWYVDPALDGNVGDGTIGNPYGDINWALNQKTRDATNGDCFNIKNSAVETLSGTVSSLAYGTPSLTAPLIFRGYQDTIGDGGRCRINCAGLYQFYNSTTLDFIHFHDMEIYNFANQAIRCDGSCSIINCRIYNGVSAASTCIQGGANCQFVDNKISASGTSGYAVVTAGNSIIAGNIIISSQTGTGGGANATAANTRIDNNCIYLTNSNATNNGVLTSNITTSISKNSILMNAGTASGQGINQTGTGANGQVMRCMGNLIEGFSAATGYAIRNASNTTGFNILDENKYFNCGGGLKIDGEWETGRNNVALGSTGFAKTGSPTLDNMEAYMRPLNTAFTDAGVIGAIAFPVDVAGAGGLRTHPGMSGGMAN